MHDNIVVIWVSKTFFILFFYMFLLAVNLFCFCKSLPSPSFIVSNVACNVLLESPTVGEIASVSLYLFALFTYQGSTVGEIASVSLYLFALFTYQGFLISPYNYLEFCILLGLSLLYTLPFISLLFSAICTASSGNQFPFLHRFFLGMCWSPPSVQCYKPPSIVL